jgi:mRNA-degrading endonuclease RelE of RelBE toxin-antitoxin system
MPYEIKFAADVRQHLEALTARERSTALEVIERQLLHEPLVETRNRKPLRPNPVAPWELRIGNLRAFYEVFLATLAWSASWPWGKRKEMLFE